MIAPNDYVQFIGRPANDGGAGYRPGAVRRIIRFETPDNVMLCVACHEIAPAFWVDTDHPCAPPWCSCAWRPYRGEERDVVRKCEVVA